MTDEAIETLRSNMDEVTKKLVENPDDPSWLKSFVKGDLYDTKEYQIEDFHLKLPSSPKDRETDIKNSIVLYEHLKVLPKFILCDEKFWNWINFEKGYRVALAYMPVKEGSSVFKDHWLFSAGIRRGLMFGVLSRCYYRIAMTYDKKSKDPYELGKFAIENPERFRYLSWKSASSEKKIVLGTLKAEKEIVEKYKVKEKAFFYSEIAKDISKLSSVMLIDVMDEEDVKNYIYAKYEKRIQSKDSVIGKLKRAFGFD